METIVLAAKNPRSLERLEVQIPDDLRKTATISKMPLSDHFVDYLRYEIPDLVVIYAETAAQDLPKLFTRLEEDPWLDSVGIILILEDVEEQIENFQGFNIAYFLNEHEIDRNLGRVIGILDEKRDFLNYDGIIKKITALSGEIVLETDLLLVQYYSSLFANYLFKEGFLDRGKKFGVKLALEELLTNAMEHGNAGITFDDKTRLQEAGILLQDEVDRRRQLPPWQGRTVRLQYGISPLSSHFTITDQGEGFDTSRLPTRGDMLALDLSHGRGIFLSMNSADTLHYNQLGNEVRVEFMHNGKAERVIPPGFIQSEPRILSPSDVVFWENTSGDHIYYIVSGEYDVFVNGRKVAKLTPADVFMGEMSFLLGNRRTATVITAKAGKLVEISRQAFTEAVKQYPNYGIFLSKMLARRLYNANRLYAG